MWTITANELSQLLQITRRLQEQQAWSGLDQRNPVENEIDRLSYREQLKMLSTVIQVHFPELSLQIKTIMRGRRGKGINWPYRQISRIATLHGELMQRFRKGEREKLFAVKLTTPCPKCRGPRLAENEGRLCNKCLSWDGKMVSIWMALKRAGFEKTEWTDESGLSTRKVADEWRQLKNLADTAFVRSVDDRELFDQIRVSMMEGEELNTFLDIKIEDVKSFLRSRSCEPSIAKEVNNGVDSDRKSAPQQKKQSVDGNHDQTSTDDSNAVPLITSQESLPQRGTQNLSILLCPILKRVYDTLKGRAMKVEQLAKATTGGDTSRLYKVGLKSILVKQRLVDHHKSVGYYRPDSPPKELVVTRPRNCRELAENSP